MRCDHPLAPALLSLALLAPFVDKPVHLDDPMYLWSALRVAADPFDPYGLSVNWAGTTEAMARVNQNPPGVSYFLAFVGSRLGWSEPALHAGMLLPALALVYGTAALARRLGASPLAAGLVLLACPGFLVSATTLMADVLATALWTGAVLAWVSGLEPRRPALLLAAGVLAAACLLTKYVGLALIPLLAAYALIAERRATRSLLALALPAVTAVIYEVAMQAAYDVRPLAAGSSFAVGQRTGSGTASRLLVGLSFLGGAAVPALLLSPWTLRRAARLTLTAVVFAAGLFALVAFLPGSPLRGPSGVPRLALALHVLAFSVSGVLVFAALVQRLRAQGLRTDTALLGLWIAGVFVFAVGLNWTTNVRSLLPALPAVAVLLADRLKAAPRLAAAVALGSGVAIGLLVAQGDQARAEVDRFAAAELSRRYGNEARPLWFQGSWGFQWYAEAAGARKIDWRALDVRPGDPVAVPLYNTNVVMPGGSPAIELRLRVPVPALATTISLQHGAGWYSAQTGPAPYVLGTPHPQEYLLLRPDRPWILGR